MNRRKYLNVVGSTSLTASAFLSGCLSSDENSSGESTGPAEDETDETDLGTNTASPTDVSQIEIVGDYPTFGYSFARTNQGREEVSPTSDESLRPAWGQPIDGSEPPGLSVNVAEPIVSDGVVYAADVGGDLTAFDATTGQRLWQQETDFYLSASPTIHGEYIYLPTGSNKVRCFRKANGDPVWDAEFGSSVDTQVAAVDDVIIASVGTLVGLSADRGKEIWSVGGGSSTWEDPEYYKVTPAVADGTIYAPGKSGIKLVDAKTGEEIDLISIPEEEGISGNPIVGADKIVQPIGVESYPGKVNSQIESYGVGVYSQSDGEIWSKPELSEEVIDISTVDSEYIYVFVPERGVLALAIEDGRIAWEIEEWASPTVVGSGANRQLIFASPKTEYITRFSGYSPEGEQLWMKEMDLSVATLPVYVDKSILVASEDVVSMHTFQDGKVPETDTPQTETGSSGSSGSSDSGSSTPTEIIVEDDS